MKAKLLNTLPLITLLALGVGWLPLSGLLSLPNDEVTVSAYLRDRGVWGILLLALGQLLQVAIAVIPGSVFTILGGYVYGFSSGLAINLVSTVGASQLTFALARWGGQPMVHRLVPASMLDRWNKIAERQGFSLFLFSFLLPIFPCDVMNFVAGLSPISPWHFLVASLLGRLPGVILLTLVGSHGLELPLQAWAGISASIAGMFLVWRYCIPKQAHHYLKTFALSGALALKVLRWSRK